MFDRLAFRLAIRLSAYNAKQPADRDLLLGVLRNPVRKNAAGDQINILDALQEDCEQSYGATASPKGDWQSFFQWILDHQDQIIAFIQAIIALFSGL